MAWICEMAKLSRNDSTFSLEGAIALPQSSTAPLRRVHVALLFFFWWNRNKPGPNIPILTFENAELTIVKLMIHPNDAVACVEKRRRKSILGLIMSQKSTERPLLLDVDFNASGPDISSKVCQLNYNPQLPVSSKCALLAAVLRSYPLGLPGAECGQDEE